jgi:hypothetical protein
MKDFLRDSRGSVLSVVTAVFVALFSVFFLYTLYKGGAEAVVGGVGNISITDNPHNFSSNSSGIKAVDETRICVFCHTPHQAISDDDLLNAPLWNHELSNEVYSVKSRGNYANTVSSTIYNVTLLVGVQQPDGTSKLCLSCHDGTLSIGLVRSESSAIAMVSNTCLDADGSLSASCSSLIVNDLTTKHVVSVPMNQSLIDNSIANCINGFQTFQLQWPWASGLTNGSRVILRPTARPYGGLGIAGDDGAIPAGLANKYSAGYNYGVQCSTCHDPHHWASGNDTPRKELQDFLVAGENDLCSSCHTPCS